MSVSLPVVNLDTATFECIFGRGCEGICCKNGRPSVGEHEQQLIESVLARVLPHLRPEARKLLEKQGYLSNRKKLDQPMVRVVDEWCVFFNKGCVLHKIGAEDGDSYQYKPSQCALFPLDVAGDGSWHVRQWGYRGEKWDDLFCLNPKATKVSAVESLQSEMEYAQKLLAVEVNGEAETE
jgi:Fe-S-cluster containining protein